MNIIDILIPLIVGLLLAFGARRGPKMASLADDTAKAERGRRMGRILIGIAAAYVVMKLATGR